MAAEDSIIDLIHSGEVDDNMDEIAREVKARQAFLRDQDNRRMMAELRERNGDTPGTRVRIRHDAPLKPRYILGATGEVVAKRISKISVRMDNDIHDPYHKWAGRIGIIDAAHLEIIEED
jgi:hypothetical protein